MGRGAERAIMPRFRAREVGEEKSGAREVDEEGSMSLSESKCSAGAAASAGSLKRSSSMGIRVCIY